MRVAVEIALSEDEATDLNKLSKSPSVSVRQAERSRIILLAGTGMTNEETGKEPGITRQKADRWRKHYAGSGIKGISQDASRPGRKPKIGSRKAVKAIWILPFLLVKCWGLVYSHNVCRVNSTTHR